MAPPDTAKAAQQLIRINGSNYFVDRVFRAPERLTISSFCRNCWRRGTYKVTDELRLVCIALLQEWT